MQAMYAPVMGAHAAGFGPTPTSRGSALTPLDGVRPLPSDGSFTGAGVTPIPVNRGRPPSSAGRPSPLASSGRMGTAMSALAGAPLQPNNLSEADNIKVAVRVRPLFPHEAERGGTPVVQVSSNTTIKVVVPGPASTSMQRDFAFHACLGPEVGQADVLMLCGVPQLLEAALAGYNVTVFAYGQTGSGKTYTMSGREEVIGSDSYLGDAADDGIMTRAIQHLFAAIEARRSETKVALTASYLEIYNEGIFDLLNLKAKNLPVKWDAALGFYVPGLKQVTCNKVDTMMEVIRTGMKHRHVGSHELNIESSRSHSIMTIAVHVTPVDPASPDFGTPRLGKISFVDLAGSERLKDTKSEGLMLKETANINKSLFVLGKVIAALAERDSSGTSAHIPYRDSKLTKLLMDSLGGNALALMIACCSPASTAVEETLSTLSYATRAKNIQNRPTVQYDPKEAQIANLRREIELLRQENSYLREQVRLGGGGQTATDVGTPLHPSRPVLPSNSAGSGGGEIASPPMGHPAAHSAWVSLLAADGSIGGSRDSSRDTAAAAAVGAGTTANGALPFPIGAAPPRLGASSRLNTASAEGVRSAISVASGGAAAAVTHLEPLRMSGESVTAGGAGGSYGRRVSSTGLGGLSLGGLGGAGGDDDLMRRLMDTQNLLARFSEENGRLAKENDRLRAGRQLLSQEHGEVLDEIELLRSKLIQLETAVLSGSQTPNAVKAALASAIAESGPGSAGRPLSNSQGGGTAAGGAAAGGAGYSSQNALLSSQNSPPLPQQQQQEPPSYGAVGSVPNSRAGYGNGPQQQHLQSPYTNDNVGSPYHPPAVPSAAAGASPPPPHSHYQQPHHQPGQPHPLQGPYVSQAPNAAQHPNNFPHLHPHLQQGQPPGPGPGPGSGAAGAVANVMAVGSAPGNANAMRTRGKYGAGGAGGAGEDSIIVADQSKLALLLGDGPIEPAVPIRPVPIKPPEPSYANAAKAHHVQLIQKQLQRGGGPSIPSSPTGGPGYPAGY